MSQTCRCCAQQLPLLSGTINPNQSRFYCDSCRIAGCPSSWSTLGHSSRACPGARMVPCHCCGKDIPAAVHFIQPKHKSDKQVYSSKLPMDRTICDSCRILGCRRVKGKVHTSPKCRLRRENKALDRDAPDVYTL